MDFTQVAALSDCQLVLAFARRIVDTSKNSFYFECCLLPGVCEVAVCSTNQEAPAFERIRKHLRRHVAVINKSPNDAFHGIFTPLPSFHFETDQQYSIEPQASSTNFNILDLPGAVVEKVSDNVFSVKIKRTSQHEAHDFIFDLSKKSVTAQDVAFPVCFPSSNFAQLPSENLQIMNANVTKDNGLSDFSCREILNDPELEWSLEIERLTENILGWWLKEHDYECLPWKIGYRYIYLECLLAVSAFNKFQALSQNIIVDVETASGLEEALNKQWTEDGKSNYVANIGSVEKNCVAVLLNSEVECFADDQVGRQIPLTGRLRGEQKPVMANRNPSPVPLVERRVLITDDASAIPDEAIADEQAKRAIALEALAALKSSRQSVKKKRWQKNAPYRCKICSKMFSAAPTLQAHYQSHAGIKNFECPVCGEKFTRKQSLNYHMLCHSGKVRYSCPWCSKLFRHTGHFKDHLRTHQKQPFICPDCHYEFPTRPTLRRHMKLSHGKETLPAEPPLIGRFALTEESFQSATDDVEVDDFGGTVSVYSASISEAHQPSCSQPSRSQAPEVMSSTEFAGSPASNVFTPTKVRKNVSSNAGGSGRGVLRIPALSGGVLQPPGNPVLPSACEASRDSRLDWSSDGLPARADEPLITRIETGPLDPTDFASCDFVLGGCAQIT